jgi:hypothetical protein
VNPEQLRSEGRWFKLIRQGSDAPCNNRVFLLLMNLALLSFSDFNPKGLHRLMNWI